MPCRKAWEKSGPQPSLQGPVTATFAALLVLALSGCGGQTVSLDPIQPTDPNNAPQLHGANEKPRPSSDDETPGAPSRLLAMLLGAALHPPKNGGQASANTQNRHIFCPEVRVLDGTEASRIYAGTPPSNTNLRYQYSLTDTARECALDGDQLAMKIGVAGKVLLGPAGSDGSFTVPVRVAIFRKNDDAPVLSKLYHATVNAGQSDPQAAFTIVSELLHVPFVQEHSEQDYTIKVGIDDGKPSGERIHNGGKQ